MYLCIFVYLIIICIPDRVTCVSYAPAACARTAYLKRVAYTFDDGHQFLMGLS